MLTFVCHGILNQDEEEEEAGGEESLAPYHRQSDSFENLPMKVRMPSLTTHMRKGAKSPSTSLNALREGGGRGRGGAVGFGGNPSNPLRVTKIAAGGWHSLAIVSSHGSNGGGSRSGGGGGGEAAEGVYAWGCNYLGQVDRALIEH